MMIQDWGNTMSVQRALTVSALALGLVAGNVAVFAGSASAQERPVRGDGRPNGKPATTATPRTVTPAPRVATPGPRVIQTPAPRVATPAPRVIQTPAPRVAAPQVQRQPQPSWRRPEGRPVGPAPSVRHAGPQHGHSGPAPRRGWGWRPWGWGAAATGAVVLGGVLARAPRSTVEACANDFEGFDWETGTIVNRYGDVELCPYLEAEPVRGPERFND
jgi:hypothetical protein